jgi:L-amino acid N-acyltransferase YncA
VEAGPDGVLDTRLRGGRHVAIRRLQPADEPALCEFIEGLCLEARRMRFFSGGVDIERMAHSVAATGRGRLGLLAVEDSGAIVGHAVAIELAPERAEVAVEVADEMHGEGLGTILIERLAELAEEAGVELFVAQVLPENRAMLDVFREGFDAHVRWREGVDFVEFPTSAWRLARARYPLSAELGAE